MNMNKGINNNNFNQNNNNNKDILKKNLYEKYKHIKDPYQLQKKIALGLNKGKPYSNYSNKNSRPLDFLSKSSEDKSNESINEGNINIIFLGLKGNKHCRVYNKDMKIKEMLKNFVLNVGLTEKALERIQFIFNATLLNNLKEDLTLTQFHIKNQSIIHIIDMQDIIGANNN